MQWLSPKIALALVIVAVSCIITSEGCSSCACHRSGGECKPKEDCREWRQPIKGLCHRPGHECCFTDLQKHRLPCGTFGGECTSKKTCGNGPRHPKARCKNKDDVCCVFVF